MMKARKTIAIAAIPFITFLFFAPVIPFGMPSTMGFYTPFYVSISYIVFCTGVIWSAGTGLTLVVGCSMYK